MKWSLRTNDFRITEIIGDVSRPAPKELMKAGIKKMLFFWFFALVCVPFPGLHFILVPFFFFYGIWSFLKIQKNHTLIRNGQYQCSHCHFIHQIENVFLNTGEKWRCNQCGTQTVVVSEPMVVSSN